MKSILVLVAATFALLFSPHQTGAHENHMREQAEPPPAAASASPAMTPGAMHEQMQDHLQAMEESRPKSWSQRLVSWFGRTHPFAVHFPIALFPVAWVALLLARRRGEPVALIRSLVIVAGAAAAVAAVLGWLTGGLPSSDPDAVHLWHRWLGTGLGALGLLLGFWVWRRPDAVAGRGLTAALGLVTLALLVQGWLGAALVHGMGHMNF